jgi:hypothetical protein
MKKPTLIFILILFAACAVVGYLIASKTDLGISANNIGGVNAATALASPQQNFLLVRVDDMNSATPKLVEAWLVLTLYSDPPQIMFIPIYPRYDADQNSSISAAFSLDSQGKLSSMLASKIANMFAVKINGYVLTDTVGMNAFTSWFGINGVSASANPPQTDDEKHAVLLNSQTFLQGFCQQLKHGDGMKQYDSIQWSQLIPYHFKTDLTFEQLIASWDRVNRAAAPQKCDVVSTE